MGCNHVLKHPQVRRVTLAASTQLSLRVCDRRRWWLQTQEWFQVRDLLVQLESVLHCIGLIKLVLVPKPHVRHRCWSRRGWWWYWCWGFEGRLSQFRGYAAFLSWWRRWWVGKVELGLVATDTLGCFVVSSGGFFGCVVGAEPNSDAFVWVSNLRRPLSPRPLPYSSVHVLPNSRSLRLPLRSALLFSLPIRHYNPKKLKKKKETF